MGTTTAATVLDDGIAVAVTIDAGAMRTAITGFPDTTGMPGSPRRDVVPDHILPTGHSFGPRYHIIDLLGVGGMGEVYRAWDSELSIAVALKVIRRIANADPRKAEEQQKRFKSELLLARKVTHKNVVRIHDIGEIDGIKYISMPYVQGNNLAGILRSEGALGIPRALKLARQIAAGLVAAHEAEVVHRDLKPANVMVDPEDHALIMDFGIAHSSHDDSSTTGVAGTLAYMAPEQATRATVDQRADIYAFGLILFEMLAGPRKHAGTPETAFVRLPPLRSLHEHIPEPLSDLVARCVELEAADRFQTSADVLTALNRLDDTGELIPEPRRLTPRLVATAATVVLALVTGMFFLGQFAVDVPVQQEEVPLVITDFANLAADPAFDNIEEILQVALEEAPYISVVDNARTLAAELFPEQTVLTRDIGQLIARREGLKVVLAGSVAAEGRGFRIDVEAVDPDTGEAITSVTRAIGDKNQVLAGVSAIAAELREAFGEAEEVTDAASTGETFTTTSLDAMRAYAEGQTLMDRARYKEAIAAYQQALKFDPQLGRAWAGMAVAYRNERQNENANQAYTQAFKLTERMTPREKYRTLGGYYFQVVGNYDLAVENYEALFKQFPADKVGLANLAFAHLMTGNVERALLFGKQAVDADPRSQFKRFNYAMYAMYNGEFETSRAQAPLLLKDDPKFYRAWLLSSLSALALGNVADARSGYANMATISDEKQPEIADEARSLASIGLADISLYLGRPAEAIPELQAGADRDERAKMVDSAALKHIALAEAYLAGGRQAQAIASARRALDSSSLDAVVYPAARVLIRTGQHKAAEQIAATLAKKLQKQTVAYADLIRGEIALEQEDFIDAVEFMRSAQKRYNSWFSRFMMGMAYAAAGSNHAEAVSEFQACIDRRGEAADVFFADTPTLRYVPAAYYWLARSQEGAGLMTQARDNYRRFLDLRTNTDTPDPLAAEAAKRLAALGAG